MNGADSLRILNEERIVHTAKTAGRIDKETVAAVSTQSEAGAPSTATTC